MKMTNVVQINDFWAALDAAQGEVTLRSPAGDVYNLKSEFSRYVALGALLGECGDAMELFCSVKADEQLFFKFLRDHPEV